MSIFVKVAFCFGFKAFRVAIPNRWETGQCLLISLQRYYLVDSWRYVDLIFESHLAHSWLGITLFIIPAKISYHLWPYRENCQFSLDFSNCFIFIFHLFHLHQSYLNQLHYIKTCPISFGINEAIDLLLCWMFLSFHSKLLRYHQLVSIYDNFASKIFEIMMLIIKQASSSLTPSFL